MGYGRWPKYVPVAKRRADAQKAVKALEKKGQIFQPIAVEGRTFAKTFWGKAWCEHIEKYSDVSNRLPRGRTYVRKGSVIHFEMTKGKVQAKVSGSSIYSVTIEIEPMPEAKWNVLVKQCGGQIDSVIELLKGKLSKNVMSLIVDNEIGLFPHKKEISMACSCPDYATMCKHVAAVLYGIGISIDTQPSRLFELRHVDHHQLIASALEGMVLPSSASDLSIVEEDLSSLFGIEMDLKEIQVPSSLTKPSSEKKPLDSSTLPGEGLKKARIKASSEKKIPLSKSEPVKSKSKKQASETKVASTLPGEGLKKARIKASSEKKISLSKSEPVKSKSKKQASETKVASTLPGEGLKKARIKASSEKKIPLSKSEPIKSKSKNR